MLGTPQGGIASMGYGGGIPSPGIESKCKAAHMAWWNSQDRDCRSNKAEQGTHRRSQHCSSPPISVVHIPICRRAMSIADPIHHSADPVTEYEMPVSYSVRNLSRLACFGFFVK